MSPDDEPEVEDALRRVMAAALLVGQARRALYDRVEQALAVGADPLEVMRASGMTNLPLDVPATDEVARQRGRGTPRRRRPPRPDIGHVG